MQYFEDITGPGEALATVAEDSVQLPGHDFEESGEFDSHAEEHVVDAPSSDDPVRVYLREMGSVRLLNRQGEIDLARRMERGKLRMRKVLSRSPIVWQMVLSVSEGARQGAVRLADFVEIGGADEAERDKSRANVTRQLARFASAHKGLLDLERRIASTPDRHVKVRAGLIASIPRLKIKCSQELRGVPFHARTWKQFQAAVAHAAAEIGRLERELSRPRQDSGLVRQLKQQIRTGNRRWSQCRADAPLAQSSGPSRAGNGSGESRACGG